MVKVNGGKGTSKEDAIVIEAANETEGVETEYMIAEEIFGKENIDWHLFQQILDNDTENKKVYDTLIIEDNKEIQYELWFDVTAFYGKYE
ncbi:MAG: hypothetical protein ACM3O3_00930 [Syntrophothermus sp.]